MRVRPRRDPATGPARHPNRSFRAALSLLAVAALAFGAFPARVGAVDGLTIEAHALLQGHARVGSWMAVAVHVKNDGPAIDGELRAAGGPQGQTRFSVAAPLPTTSDKTIVLYVQPPAFGRELEIDLVEGGQTIAKTKATFTIHDASQLIVGVVAERASDIVGDIDLQANQQQLAPVVIPLTPADLPDRVEAWDALDRIVWQDTDSALLTDTKLASLRGWVAGGGRLVIAGGTGGPAMLSAFPDDLLPYRPTATVDVAAASLASLVGTVPAGSADLPALGGTLIAGRALLTSGDRVIAADRAYGSGAVTILGFDPTTKWISQGDASRTLWRRVLPTRISSGLVVGDDSQLVGAVAQTPSLALPPIGGLVGLLGAYILLIGPINYLVLRRIDRREWAWITMPALIGVFAVSAYVFGATLRGSDVLINQVAVVRGAPGATDGTAQVYVGVFSPARGTYQVSIPGRTLLSSPTSGDAFGGAPTAASLDVVQGETGSRVRDLDVGFGSLRTIRADTSAAVPLIHTDLVLRDGALKGTITNDSQVTLLRPAVVLGGNVQVLADLAPGARVDVSLPIVSNQFGIQLSDKVVGQLQFDSSQFTPDQSNQYIRHTILDALTYDPNFGSTGTLSADGAVILAWGDGGLLPVEIAGQHARTTGKILYYLPAAVGVSGSTTFRGDLVTQTIVDAGSAQNFSKDPYTLYFGPGKATVSYRPLSFSGTISPTELGIAINGGGGPGAPVLSGGTAVDPLTEIPPACPDTTKGCVQAGFDGTPEVELFDLQLGDWRRLPHLTPGTRYLVSDPSRYIDPSSGIVLARYVNERTDGIGFSVDLSITGNVR